MQNMKKIYTMAAGFLLCAGLASCEMKEEIFGKGEVPSETGKVELGVSVDDKTNVVITKADADDGGEEIGSSVDASEYEVIFTHQEADYTKDCIYEDIEGMEVILPIGKYTVESHTPGTLEKEMTYPYYGGDAELNVTKDVTSQAEITCKMMNSRILLTYGSDFTSKFKSWTITIDDGSDKTLTYTEANKTPDAVYWYFGEECAEITINVTAVNDKGETIRESRTITKPAGSGNDNWTGGDALTITMEPGSDEIDPENPSGVVGSGINIKVEAFFPESTDLDDTIWVDIDGEETTDPDEGEGEEGDGDEDPDTPATGSLSMTMPGNGAISYSISAGNAPAKADVVINAPEGISSLVVKMSSTNDDFKVVVDDLAAAGLDFKTNGVEVVGNPTMSEILGAFAGGDIEIPALVSGATSYTFPIASFFGLINGYEGGGTYTFSITLKDAANETIDDELILTITD